MSSAAASASSDTASIDAIVMRLEIELFQGTSAEFDTLDRLVPIVTDHGDDELLGRVLTMLSRVQIVQGAHERAIATAQTALDAFGRLDARVALRCSGARAEALRSGGNALLKLGYVAQALPKLEEAVEVAQTGIEAATRGDHAAFIPALRALVRGLITLGAALFATRQTDTAISVYYRTLAVADAHPEVYEHFPDDVMLALWNLIDTLHDRARLRRIAGNEAGAVIDFAAAQSVLDMAGARIEGPSPAGAPGAACIPRPLTPYGREGYYGSLGRHLLLTGRPTEALGLFERQLAEIQRQGFVHRGTYALAQSGLAQVMLALGRPATALEHSRLALDALDEHDDATDRASILLVHSAAQRSLGQHAEAYETLEQHNAVRSRLDAVAANQYATLMTARLGLERARAEVESHRRVAETLETLGRVGQQITANLDPDRICRILASHLRALLGAPQIAIWLLDETGSVLALGHGIDGAATLWAEPVSIADPASTVARVARDKQEIEREPASHPAHFAPLIVGDRVVGVISMQSDRTSAYSDDERSIFRTLCTYGAIALDNAAAYTKLERTVVALQATQTELATRTAEYERLSMTDPLTGLGNRRHFHERAAVEISERRRKGSELAVAMFDIDHFKRVNDSYGHATGDIVLQAVARRAKEWLRPADFIARIGGEEFALLLPGAGAREALAIAERIRISIAETAIIAGDTAVAVTASFGVACFDHRVDTLDRAMSRADAALYVAKHSGRDRVNYGQ